MLILVLCYINSPMEISVKMTTRLVVQHTAQHHYCLNQRLTLTLMSDPSN